MPVKKTWIDPNSGKEYSYNWGFDVDSTIPKKKNYADYFGWAVESIETNKAEKNIKVTITGYPKHECVPFSVNEIELERNINNRMNGEEKELETALMRRMSNTMYGAYSNRANCKIFVTPQIKNVIFNPPATIVFWTDGTKTVVKCQNGEAFDPEKGITMAFFKKMNGNKGHYFEEIKKWREKYNQTADKKTVKTDENPKWYILYRIGTSNNTYVYDTVYSTKYNAIRRAKKMFLYSDINVSWAVVPKNDVWDPNTDDKDIEWHHS